MTTMMITWPDESRPHAWVGFACFWWGTWAHVRRRRGRRSLLPVMRLCSSVILAVHCDDVGTPRRRGDRPRAEFRVVDVVRRPPRPRNHNKIKADAVYSSSWTDAGLDGTGEAGTGPIGPRGVFACGMMRVGLRWARGECFS